MKLDLGTFSFGSSVLSGGGTPSWGTALGQGKGLKFTYPGWDNIIAGMLYKMVPTSKVYMPIGKGGRIYNGLEDENIQIAAMFEEVYINEIKVNAPFILVVYKDNSSSWKGRRSLKYSDKIEYKVNSTTTIRNADFISAARDALRLQENSCWVVSDMYVEDQEILHLFAGIVDYSNSITFPTVEQRKTAWLKAINTTLSNSSLYKRISADEGVQSLYPLTINGIDNYSKLLTALRTKPFLLLAGFSGTGKSRIVRELAFKSCPEGLRDADGTTPGNYCMIEVKPNWHDSSELLGYYSNISKQYRFTKFISFLVKAMMFPNVPFFVCLDEMNLAPVEQYFAEFLSILETRKKTEEGIQTGILVSASNFLNVCNGEETEDGIIALRFFPNLCWIENQIYSQKKLTTQGLSLPDNVFIIGTVNMDDTTHQFSRKVIDRAMTIEMNGGNLKDMFGGSRNLDYLPSSDVWPIELFKPRFVSADEVLSAYPQYAKFIQTILPEKLDGINQVLQGTPFQVSYRVLNEMVIYLSVLLGDGITFNDAVDQTIDRIMLMKILPRIEGDRELLMANSQISRLEKLMAFATLDETKQKLKEMNERLVKQDFTRFWP